MNNLLTTLSSFKVNPQHFYEEYCQFCTRYYGSELYKSATEDQRAAKIDVLETVGSAIIDGSSDIDVNLPPDIVYDFKLLCLLFFGIDDYLEADNQRVLHRTLLIIHFWTE